MSEILLVQLPYYLCSLAAFATAGLGVGVGGTVGHYHPLALCAEKNVAAGLFGIR